jgi:hypothetical protein
VAVAVGLGAAPGLAGDTPLDGRAIMLRVEARPRGADETLHATWHLIDKRGGERARRVRAFWRDERGDAGDLHSKRLIVFDAPAAIRGTAFLVHSRSDPGEEDLRWVYLPALRKVRRIAGRDRDKRFAGSDFTYDDLGERAPDEDDHVLLRDEDRDGRLHHVVESRPRGPAAYARRLQWIDAERLVVTRAEFYDSADRLERTLEARWTERDGIWFWEYLELEDLRRKHRTRVEVREIRHDEDLPEDLFQDSTLALGIP